MTIRAHKQNRKAARSIFHFGIIALMALLAFVLAFDMSASAFMAKVSASPTTPQSSMAGMISGHSLNQSEIAECNQMMSDYGLNQSVISGMDQMMSSNMMGMMSGGMMHGV